MRTYSIPLQGSGIHLPSLWAIQNPCPIIWRQPSTFAWNVQLGSFFMCDWGAGGEPLKHNTDLGLPLQSVGLFPGLYQIHVLCPNIRIWLSPPMDSVFVCNESLSGDQVEGFFCSGVKERLRLLVQTVLRKMVWITGMWLLPLFFQPNRN